MGKLKGARGDYREHITVTEWFVTAWILTLLMEEVREVGGILISIYYYVHRGEENKEHITVTGWFVTA